MIKVFIKIKKFTIKNIIFHVKIEQMFRLFYNLKLK